MSILLYVFAALVAIIFIIAAIKAKEPAMLLGVVGSALLVLLGFAYSQDTSYPIVKATLNDTVSYVEVAEHYEYISREGDLWTFKVLEDNERE